jgi:hypothetical protein
MLVGMKWAAGFMTRINGVLNRSFKTGHFEILKTLGEP